MINKNGRYNTCEGHQVRIYHIFEDQKFGVHGAVLLSIGWIPIAWTLQGRFNPNRPGAMDLVEHVPGKTPGTPMADSIALAA